MITSIVNKRMELVSGWEVTVKMNEDIQNYALDFLYIFNNVRNNEEMVSVTNYPGINIVSVVCYPDALEATKAYLSQFGKITDIDRALIVRCGDDLEYDYETYATAVCDFQEF